MGTRTIDRLKVDVIEVTDKIILSGATPIIQVKDPIGKNNPLKIQVTDTDGISTVEFIINGTGAGDISHNGNFRKISTP